MPPPGSKFVRNWACISASRRRNPAQIRCPFKRCRREEHPKKEDACQERRYCESNIAPHRSHNLSNSVRGELEAKRMTAPKTNVFGPQTAGVISRDVMTKHHTAHGMSDHFEIGLCFKKRVSASACVFSCLRIFFDYMNAMAQQSAEIVDFLFELVVAGMRVGT